MFFVFIMRVPD